ncbi:RipA family octameric membrane protein [Streptomyces decoyicus]|uniref:RipA family octameric membrane protein n=1 Tax=Streptomyces decoyicus TaxID=249567 RepID=UPI00380F4951
MPDPRSAPPPLPDGPSAGDESEADREPPAVLELYKLAVEMADRVSARRGQANVFFLSIQTAFVSVIGVALPNLRHDPLWVAPVIALAGVAISMTWWLQLRSYRDLNRAKFVVIHAIETQLPVRVFTDEWAHLTRAPAIPRRVRYAELGFSERMIPWIFVLLHGLLCLGRLLA